MPCTKTHGGKKKKFLATVSLKKNKKQRKHKLARKNFVFRVNIEKFYTDEEEEGGDVSQLQNYRMAGKMQS